MKQKDKILLLLLPIPVNGERIAAIGCTLNIRKRDTETKLVAGCTDGEITIIEEVHNGRYQSTSNIR